MRFNKWTIGLAAMCAAILTISAKADTTVITNASGGTTTITNDASQANGGTFVHNAFTWATSFNADPTLAWGPEQWEASSGYKQATGSGASSYVTVLYDFDRINVGVDFQFFGVGSAINQFEAQAGYAFIVHEDFKAEANLLAGWDTGKDCVVVEPELILKKALTQNTFAVVGVSLPEFTKGNFNTNPQFKAGFGFRYWPGEK